MATWTAAPREHGKVSLEERVRLKVLVTGASGFIGSNLLPLLSSRGFDVLATSRSPVSIDGIEWQQSPELEPDADWSNLVRGAHTVVHLAGRAHVLHGRGSSGERLFQRINADGTSTLARQAAQAGVRHFVFLSSCHTVAEESDLMLTRDTPPRPVSAYGRSKLAAENALREELDGRDCAWTILRPPLVYGAGNKANFARLVSLVRHGWPLPLAGIRNRRSFLGAANLADFIARCLSNVSSVHGKIYYPADARVVSTPELLRLLGQSMGRSVNLFPVPHSLLRAAGRLLGLRALRKLTSSLFVDAAPAREELQWSPPHTMEDLLRTSFGEAT